MLIRMLSDRRGAVDGFTLRDYRAGETYDLVGTGGADLARVFLAQGWAVEASHPAAVLVPDPPAEPAAPEPHPEPQPEPEASHPAEPAKAKRKGK